LLFVGEVVDGFLRHITETKDVLRTAGARLIRTDWRICRYTGWSQRARQQLTFHELRELGRSRVHSIDLTNDLASSILHGVHREVELVDARDVQCTGLHFAAANLVVTSHVPRVGE